MHRRRLVEARKHVAPLASLCTWLQCVRSARVLEAKPKRKLRRRGAYYTLVIFLICWLRYVVGYSCMCLLSRWRRARVTTSSRTRPPAAYSVLWHARSIGRNLRKLFRECCTAGVLYGPEPEPKAPAEGHLSYHGVCSKTGNKPARGPKGHGYTARAVTRIVTYFQESVRLAMPN